jgi:menaquinol-cytochrome c reductase iron-sulfur subunit
VSENSLPEKQEPAEQATGDTSEELPEGSSRRGFLGATVVIGGVMGAMVAGPIAPFFAAPLLEFGEEGAQWVPVGPAESFMTGRREAEYSFDAMEGWYSARRTRRVLAGFEEGQWVVFSTECTHFGCGVTWKPEQRQFYCPCHGGVFDEQGDPIVPPPDRPLKRLEARVNEETGMLEVREA